ncbi:MAG: V-type ATP synthase subunit F [Christensenellaceae bacterium]
MYRIGVIGDFSSVNGFMALGLDVVPVESVAEAEKELRRMCADKYGVIYITEPLMAQMEEACNRIGEEITPAVVPIPTGKGSTGYGEGRLREYVRQAVGSDIIFGNE